MYRSLIAALILLLLWVLLLSCSREPRRLEPPGGDILWTYEANGIVLRLDATERLNWYDGAPASLSLCLYQLTDKYPVAGMLALADGVQSLQACTRSDPSIRAAQRVFVNPGQSREIFFDREEGVKFLVLVAGFYTGTPEGMALLREVPVPPARQKSVPALLRSDPPPRVPVQAVLALHLDASGMTPRPANADSPAQARP